MRRMLTAMALLSLGTVLHAQDDFHGGSLQVHGYEHGYRDGYAYGRDAKGRGIEMNYHTDAFRDADNGYREYMGSKDEYREGYRDGYRSGAENGYHGDTGGLQRTFGYHGGEYDPDAHAPDQSTAVYVDRHWDYKDVASDVGYRDGVNAGLKDFREHHSFRPQEHDSWKDGNHGFSSAFGRKDDYRQAYRAAYEAGYRDGFGLR